MNTTIKNIFIFSFAGIAFGIIAYLFLQRDKEIVDLWDRNKYTTDSIYTSPADRKSAQQFSDTILPALKQKGLVISLEQTEMQTVITVSGTLWKQRSLFFKENFLTRMMIYNRVRGFSIKIVMVVDGENGETYARIIPPGRKELYE